MIYPPTERCLLEEPNNGLNYQLSSDYEFPSCNYLSNKYNAGVSKLSTHDQIMLDKSFYPWFLANIKGSDELIQLYSFYDKEEVIYRYTYELPDLKAILTLMPQQPKKGIGDSGFTFLFYYVDRTLVEGFIEDIKVFYKKKVVGKENNISLIIQNGPELDTQEYEVKINNLDIALNYGEDFVPVYNKIVQRLNTKKDKGIVLLHGIPGTGKTSLIKYLAKKIKKEILFVPPSMAESITSPGFIPFLMNHSNSVLIIEDAERILTDRNQQGANQGVSNILNISDGILGDCLNIQVIATFNTDLTNIDAALLRKGRLIAEHEFKKLSIDQSNKLLQHLGKTAVATEAMPLTDIYNVDEEVFKSKQGRRAVGFNAR